MGVVLLSMYIQKTKTSNKMVDGNLSSIQRILKTGQKSDSLSVHYDQHFKFTTSRTDLNVSMSIK